MAPLSSAVAVYMHAVIGVLALTTFAAISLSDRTSGQRSQDGYSIESFEGGAAGRGGRKLVVIHAAWCGHCTTLLSAGGVWSRVKKSLPGVHVTEIDEADEPDLISKLDIKGFPDIRIMDGTRTVATFNGQRTVDAIVEFALKHIPAK